MLMDYIKWFFIQIHTHLFYVPYTFTTWLSKSSYVLQIQAMYMPLLGSPYSDMNLHKRLLQYLVSQVKFQLSKSLVVSILFHGCEIWTLLAEPRKGIKTFENKCMRNCLRMYYWGRKINNCARIIIKRLVAQLESLLVIVKHREMAWFDMA